LTEEEMPILGAEGYEECRSDKDTAGAEEYRPVVSEVEETTDDEAGHEDESVLFGGWVSGL
jgi:hypothetical protein